MSRSALLRLLIAFSPLAATPGLVHVLAEGYLDLGGGEKDLVLVVPWLLGSLLFAGGSLVAWGRGEPLSRSTFVSVLGALAGLLLAALALAAVGRLGVAGIF